VHLRGQPLQIRHCHRCLLDRKVEQRRERGRKEMGMFVVLGLSLVPIMKDLLLPAPP